MSSTAISRARLSTQNLIHGVLVAAIVVMDQVTKYLSNTLLPYAQAQPVVPGFDLLLVYNRGAAFSFLDDAGGWQRWALAVVSLVVSIVIALWLWRLPARQRLLGIALALVLGGALGNLYDRMVLGYVIDFVSLYYGSWRFATFNIADAAISIGALLLAIDVFTGEQSDGRS
ncbi:MAG TPA: lipoprotein signal peptidase [Pseudomonadaceae bacterium]|nr:lipoprotein signal peptidase [Pseudomonadaceae bacterium]